MNRRYRLSRWVLAAYCVYLILPLYWLLTLALRSNADIAGVFELVPSNPTLANFAEILSNPVSKFTELCAAQYVDIGVCGPARGLCVFSVSFFGRSAAVFLAAEQSNGASSSIPVAIFPALLLHRLV